MMYYNYLINLELKQVSFLPIQKVKSQRQKKLLFNRNPFLLSIGSLFPFTFQKHQLVASHHNIYNQMQKNTQNLNNSIQVDQNTGKYRSIDFKTRKILITMVSENGFSIYRAAIVLGINHSTAKAIMRKYHKSGLIFCRKAEEVCSSSSQKSLNGPHHRSKESTKKAEKKDEAATHTCVGPIAFQPIFNQYRISIFYALLPISFSPQYCIYSAKL